MEREKERDRVGKERDGEGERFSVEAEMRWL